MDWKTIYQGLCLVGVAILSYRFFCLRFGPPKKLSRPKGTTRGVHLHQVHPIHKDAETDIDIIAIHGLDTKSPDTWEYANRDNPKKPKVNWLQDPLMLPSEVGKARIFMCDWPAEMFETSDLAQKKIEEIARLLVAGIKQRPMSGRDRQDRPILFIASCLGGIILMKALTDTSHDDPVRSATRGVVFLSTPFGGTSFQDIARWAEPGLTALAWLRGRKMTTLLDNVKGPTFELNRLVGSFTELYQERSYLVFTFYELGYTSLYSKVLPKIICKLFPTKQLVDELSGTLSVVRDPLPLDRPHVMMNKFCDPKHPDYKLVADKIREYLLRIRKGGLLERADMWLRQNHYTTDRLKIERLSGELLPMDRCYINLAIVEQTGLELGSRRDRDTQAAPFSLATRLGVETPSEDIQVDIPTIFEKRGKRKSPRRVLIRGRAGVGKTTLCKKIVHDFVHRDLWDELFVRILWVPLRNLKTKQKKINNLKDLLYAHYFSQTLEGKNLARELWAALDASEYRKTLFIFDGLDEISEGLDEDSKMFDLLDYLLKLPNVVVTSRPHVKLPYWLRGTFDLELETIGFYADQVEAYIQQAFSGSALAADCNKPAEINSFLEKNRLIQSLMRIPIQLDALCYTWDDFDGQSQPQTMTAIYAAIENRLWKKDTVKLGRRSRREMGSAHLDEIKRLVPDEIRLVEILAFAGMYNDVIDFEAEHRNEISKQFSLPTVLDETLNQLSFLRTSDLSSKEGNRNYHFLHLTFQEYFAARYFVRQWKTGKSVDCLNLFSGKNDSIPPTKFLGSHKYRARYDIVWRFVAGLLDLETEQQETVRFFRAMEEKPIDILGPTHQRLVMHCLNEVQSDSFPLREKLEGQLSKWFVFQCKFIRDQNQNLAKGITLASEIEFPGNALNDFLEEDDAVKIIAFHSMEQRHQIPPQIMRKVISLLQSSISNGLAKSIIGLLGSSRDELSEQALYSMASHLENQDEGVRNAARYALHVQAMPKTVIDTIAAKLEHPDKEVRWAAGYALGVRSIPNEKLNDLVARLGNHDQNSRSAASDALRLQLNLPEEVVITIAATIEHEDNNFKWASINALCGQADLPEGIVRLIADQLSQTDRDVRKAAANVLRRQSKLPEDMLNLIAEQVKVGDKRAQFVLIGALNRQSKLPEGTLRVLAALVESRNKITRLHAISALDGQSDSESTLNAIVARLEDPDQNVRMKVIKALSKPHLPEGIVHKIAARLGARTKFSRKFVLRILSHQSNLPKELLGEIAAYVEDRNPSIRTAAINALGGQSNLSEFPETIDQIAAHIEDPDVEVRIAAIQAVSHPSMSERILHTIMAQITDHNELVRSAVLQVLARQPILAENTLNAIVARTNDQNKQVRWDAIQVLSCQSTLPEGALDEIAVRFSGLQITHIRSFQWLVKTLLLHDKFHSTFLLRGRAQYLLSLLLFQSFKGQLAWYIQDGESYLEAGNHLRAEKLPDGPFNIEKEMELARERAGVPSVTVLSF